MPPQKCELRFSFWKLPWATRGLVEGIAYTIASIVNPFITILGYEFLYMVLEWEKGYWSFFYEKKATPVPPLAVIMAAILTVCLAVGIVIYGIAWLIEAVKEAEVVKTKKQLLDEGSITSEQYTELVKAQEAEKPPAVGWEAFLAMIPTILAIFFAIEIVKTLRRKE